MLDAVERHYPIAHRWFRRQGRHPRPRPARAARPVRADRRGPLGRLPRGPAASSTPPSAASRRASPTRRRLLRRAPHRRRAALGQARRRLLRLRRPGRLALRADELHRPHGRRDDARPRARATACTSRLSAERQTALSFGTGLALAEVPSTFAELLAFDHLLETETRPGHPARAHLRARRGLVRHGLPPDRADALRAARLRPARRGRHAHRRPALGDLVRGERQVLRRQRRPARRATGWAGPTSPTSSHTRFYTYAYVFAHLSTLALYARYREVGRRLRRRLPRLPVGRRLAGPRPSCWARWAWTSRTPRSGSPGFREMERMVEVAEAG